MVKSWNSVVKQMDETSTHSNFFLKPQNVWSTFLVHVQKNEVVVLAWDQRLQLHHN